MKTIPLTQGQFAIVDDEDFESLSKHKWYFLKEKNYPGRGYAVRNIKKPGGGTTLEIMHRVILGLSKGEEADHIDRVGTHNWRSNLRKCTRSENQYNRGLFKNNTSGHAGIFRYMTLSGERFTARVFSGGKSRLIGTYKVLDDALAARREAMSQMGL